MENEESHAARPEPVEDAVEDSVDPDKHLRDLVAAGDFKDARREVLEHNQDKRKSAAILKIDPVALVVLGVCAIALVVIAAATLFH